MYLDSAVLDTGDLLTSTPGAWGSSNWSTWIIFRVDFLKIRLTALITVIWVLTVGLLGDRLRGLFDTSKGWKPSSICLAWAAEASFLPLVHTLVTCGHFIVSHVWCVLHFEFGLVQVGESNFDVSAIVHSDIGKRITLVTKVTKVNEKLEQELNWQNSD